MNIFYLAHYCLSKPYKGLGQLDNASESLMKAKNIIEKNHTQKDYIDYSKDNLEQDEKFYGNLK